MSAASSNTKPTPQHRSFSRNGRILLRLCTLFARLDLPDRLDAPEGRPVLFAGNHRSFFDIAVAYAVFAKLGFSSAILVRADLFDKPLIGSWLRRTGCIPMSRAVRHEAEEAAVAALAAGHTVSIMPEGRLVPVSERADGVGPVRPGVARIAQRSGAAVIPVAFYGTDRVWPRGVPGPIPRIKRPRVVLRLGPAIELAGHDHQADADAVIGHIRNMLHAIEADEQQLSA